MSFERKTDRKEYIKEYDLKNRKTLYSILYAVCTIIYIISLFNIIGYIFGIAFSGIYIFSYFYANSEDVIFGGIGILSNIFGIIISTIIFAIFFILARHFKIQKIKIKNELREY